MVIKLQKKDIRKQIRSQREQLDGDEKQLLDKILFERFFRLYQEEFASYQQIYMYVSTDEEPDTKAIIRSLLAAGKKVAIPKVVGQELVFYQIDSLDNLDSGYMGILEPQESFKPIVGIGLVLVPGLAFDKKGYRIGYGGGYYDRFLKEHPYPTVAIAYQWQMMDAIPKEDFDIPVSRIVTNTHIYE